MNLVYAHANTALFNYFEELTLFERTPSGPATTNMRSPPIFYQSGGF